MPRQDPSLLPGNQPAIALVMAAADEHMRASNPMQMVQGGNGDNLMDRIDWFKNWISGKADQISLTNSKSDVKFRKEPDDRKEALRIGVFIRFQ